MNKVKRQSIFIDSIQKMEHVVKNKGSNLLKDKNFLYNFSRGDSQKIDINFN